MAKKLIGVFFVLDDRSITTDNLKKLCEETEKAQQNGFFSDFEIKISASKLGLKLGETNSTDANSRIEDGS